MLHYMHRLSLALHSCMHLAGKDVRNESEELKNDAMCHYIWTRALHTYLLPSLPLYTIPSLSFHLPIPPLITRLERPLLTPVLSRARTHAPPLLAACCEYMIPHLSLYSLSYLTDVSSSCAALSALCSVCGTCRHHRRRNGPFDGVRSPHGEGRSGRHLAFQL